MFLVSHFLVFSLLLFHFVGNKAVWNLKDGGDLVEVVMKNQTEVCGILVQASCTQGVDKKWDYLACTQGVDKFK